MYKTRDELLTSLLDLEADAPSTPPSADCSPYSANPQKDSGDAPKVSFPPEWGRAITAAAKHGVQLIASPANALPLGASRIGGTPDLPAGTSWPTRTALPELAAKHQSESEEGTNCWSLGGPPTPKQLQKHKTESAKLAKIFGAPAPLSFLAQINFAELAATGALKDLPDMPMSGHLLLFYDMVQHVWGLERRDSAGFQCHYFDIESSTLERHEAPQSLRTTKPSGEFEQCSVAAEPWIFMPDPMQDNVPGIPPPLYLDDVFGEAICDWQTEVEHSRGHPYTRLGGWPSVIQNPMEIECAMVTAGKSWEDEDLDVAAFRELAKDWQLLLQIDSDEATGMEWGDGGIAYLWIRTQDLRARKFQNTWLIIQCM